jgi:GAF domain-containing protein
MIVVNDYPSHHLAKADRVQRGIKSVLVAPILSQGSVIGVVVVNSHENNHFTAERVDLVLRTVKGLGSLLETARLEDEGARAEQELRESERRFRQISENAIQVVFRLDHQTYQVLYVNEKFEEI